jgi:hypothetical protein
MYRSSLEDMWFSLQDCYNKFQSSHVVYPYPLRLGLPYNLWGCRLTYYLRRQLIVPMEAASLYLQPIHIRCIVPLSKTCGFPCKTANNKFQSSHVVYPYPLRLGLPYNF